VAGALSTAPAARHRVLFSPYRPGQLCLDHLLQITRNEGDHADPVGGDGPEELARDSPADQRAHAQLHQVKGSLGRPVVYDRFIALADNPTSLAVHDVEQPGNIEDRCNSILPDGKCDLHTTEFWLCLSTRYGMQRASVEGLREGAVTSCGETEYSAQARASGGEAVAGLLLLETASVAGTLPSALCAGASVVGGKGDAESLDSAVERCLVDSELLCRSPAVEVVLF